MNMLLSLLMWELLMKVIYSGSVYEALIVHEKTRRKFSCWRKRFQAAIYEKLLKSLYRNLYIDFEDTHALYIWQYR